MNRDLSQNDCRLGRRSFMASAMFSGAAMAAMPSLAHGEGSEQKLAKRLSFNRNIPLTDPYDVVVCGGGPSGFAASLAARRCGLKVLLIESMGQLGGVGTSGLIPFWLGGRSLDCKRWVVGGLFKSFAEDAAKQGFALLPEPPKKGEYSPFGWLGSLYQAVPFDPFAMSHYLDHRAVQAGMDLLLLTQAVDVLTDGDRITHVVIFNKSGLAAVPAKAVIDATGDADIAYRSGCGVVKGRKEDGLTAPATLSMMVEQIDQDELSKQIHANKTPRFLKKIEAMQKTGEWPFSYNRFITVQLDQPGTMLINTSRLCGVDGTDGKSMTDGMILGRRESYQLLEIMRKHFPGFSQAKIKAIAPMVGIRETRRIKADFVLTVEDLTSNATFDDTIGFSAYIWDLPDPKRPSHNPSHGKKMEETPIPYRVMVPRPIKNLIVPGRAISVERPVLGPLRVMAPCMAMGEAAGHAAAQVAKNGDSFADVDINLLKKQLEKNGAILKRH